MEMFISFYFPTATRVYTLPLVSKTTLVDIEEDDDGRTKNVDHLVPVFEDLPSQLMVVNEQNEPTAVESS